MSRYAYQNLNERIEKLKKHLKSRRGRRDLIALGTLADIQAELAGRLTYDKMNAMMRFYYNEEASMFKDIGRRLGESPMFAFMKKEGAKYEPVSFLPEKPMSYTYDEDPPIKTHAASKEYRDNYDTIDWGPDEEPKPVEPEGFAVPPPIAPEVLATLDAIKKSAEACVVCGETGHEQIEAFGGVTVTACPEVPPDRPMMVPSSDEINCTFKSYANLVVPLEAQIGPVDDKFDSSEEDAEHCSCAAGASCSSHDDDGWKSVETAEEIDTSK